MCGALNIPKQLRHSSNLALLCCDQGKYDQAEPLYLQAMDIYEKAWGTEHPEVATALDNLAQLYSAQGKYEQAEPLYQLALAIAEKGVGTEHTSTATIVDNLANLYRSQGKYEQAEPLYLRALTIRENVLGTEHPETAITLNNLHPGDLLHAQQQGSAPAQAFARADVAALQAHADESLTLIDNSGDDAYQADFLAQQKLLGPGPGTLLAAAQAPAGNGAVADAQAWYRAHAALRALDDGGNHAEAVQSALAGPAAISFARLSASLSDGINADQAVFASSARGGRDAFTGLARGHDRGVAGDGGRLPRRRRAGRRRVPPTSPRRAAAAAAPGHPPRKLHREHHPHRENREHCPHRERGQL